MQKLIDNLDRDLKYAIEEEGKLELDVVTNYDDVKEEIKSKVGSHLPACIVCKQFSIFSPLYTSISMLFLTRKHSITRKVILPAYDAEI